MDRSRSKRNYNYYYFDQDSDSQTPPPPRSNKTRFHNNHTNDYRRRGGGGGDRRPKFIPQDSTTITTVASNSNNNSNRNSTNSPFATSYMILCPDIKAGSVIGKSGSIIKSLRQETGAWINVHQILQGDDERIIETGDNCRREPDGRPPQYSPAQEALLLIHDRILDAEFEFGGGGGGGFAGSEEEMDEYGMWERGGGGGRVTTKLVVPRMHVGCLMGKGGKIIEQMRMETKTHIRILPRDQNMPQCVTMSEEIVQVVGDPGNVKKAVVIISSRLKESMHRDRGPFVHRRLQSPDRALPQDDEYGPYTNNVQHRSDGADVGPRLSGGFLRQRNNYASHSSGYAIETDANQMNDPSQLVPLEEIVFRILCPNDKVEKFIGDSDGLLQILRGDVGVDVNVTNLVHGSDERIIIISSEEGPDDELFPAQEALLHIQSYIVDLSPDKDNVVTTRLLVPSSDISCLEGRESRDGALFDIKRLTNADVQILPRDEYPLCVHESDELVQIVGEIRAARNALVEVTARLRSFLYLDIANPKDFISPSECATSRPSGAFGIDSISPDKVSSQDGFQGIDNPDPIPQSTITLRQSKDLESSGNEPAEREDGNNALEESQQTEMNSSPNASVVAKRSIEVDAPERQVAAKRSIEVDVPEHAIRNLSMKSGSKLTLISQLSGATVNFVEDRSESTQKVIQISGTPGQAEKAESLLQGFILSTALDDTN